MYRLALISLFLLTHITGCTEDEHLHIPTRNTEEHTRIDIFRLRQQHQFFKREEEFIAGEKKENNLNQFGLRCAALKLDSMETHQLDSLEFEIHSSFYGDGLVNIKQGKLFSRNKVHTEIIVSTENQHFCTILTEEDTLLQITLWWDNYISDFIADINGDGHNDFMIQWFPSCGCCPRDIRDVYLYNAEKDEFTQKFEFPNPVFFPKEHKVRGMNYGHPGETTLYCYNWQNLELDTLEFIHLNPADSTFSSFIRTDVSWLGDTSMQWSETIKAPDTKYRELDSYNWFLGCYTD